MSGLVLSRIRLRQDPAVAALARLLVPDTADARVAAAHHLVWAAFAQAPGQTRSFLWREEGPGRFMTLSAGPPTGVAGLFLIESKPFEPALATGDRLGFALRANPVIARSTAPGLRGQVHDVVMDALYHAPPGTERAAERPTAILAAGRAWLARQGTRSGFRPDEDVTVDGYERQCIPRGDEKPAVFGRVDLEGALTVTDPALFLSRLRAGFGRARAFGCGLMLIRRLPV